ncbi:MAG: ABC transporter ATP-binding protein [Cryobacterium sp.]|nr:ABC transporter ATP-binding protein [Cryobacterium sp.]
MFIEVTDVTKVFDSRGEGRHPAVDSVSLTIERGESRGLVGESGSGKSTLGRIILGLLPATQGTVKFDGIEMTSLRPRDLRVLRSRIQVVFQEPFESLNPRRAVGDIVAEPLVLHAPGLSRSERRQRVEQMFDSVGLSQEMMTSSPSDLSGGQQQRVGIARAFITDPDFVVLDEPTASLDVSVRSQILRLLSRLQRDRDTAYLFISHDINTVEYISETVSVMESGKIVESGNVEDVLNRPSHAYTKKLLSARLSLDPRDRVDEPVSTGP